MARRKQPSPMPCLTSCWLAPIPSPKSALEANGLLHGLKKALAERALKAEMDRHLAGGGASNSRGFYAQTLEIFDILFCLRF